MISPPLNGLVLVGGKSSRMHKPKAYLDFGRGAQWQVCEQVLSSVCEQVYFSISPSLSPRLPAHVPVIDDIFITTIGPLGALLSAFDHAPDAAFFVVSCDAPHFDEEAAQYLRAARNPKKMATVFEHDGHVEPLLAMYEPAIFLPLASAWALKKRCMRQIVGELEVERVTCPKPQWLHNINHAHEYAAYEHQSNAKVVTVHFYASLREHMQQSCASVATRAQTVGELYQELQRRYGFMLDANLVRYAHNDALVDAAHAFFDNDEIVFIPPVSGG